MYIKLDENGKITEVSEKNFPWLEWTDREIIEDVDGSLIFADTIQDMKAFKKAKAAQALNNAKLAKLRKVAAWTEQLITGGFISSCTGEAVQYDSDRDTQSTMIGIALNAMSEQFAKEYPNGCPVRGYKVGEAVKSVQMLTGEQILLWNADLSIHIGNSKQAGWKKQAEVEAAETIEALAEITLE